MEEVSALASSPTRTTFTTCAVEVETSAEQVIVSLSGELDMGDADQVAEVLVSAAAAGKQAVRVRLDNLTFADSSAVKAILIGAKAAEDSGVSFELANPRGLVNRLLEVTGLNVALTVVHDTDSAST